MLRFEHPMVGVDISNVWLAVSKRQSSNSIIGTCNGFKCVW